MKVYVNNPNSSNRKDVSNFFDSLGYEICSSIPECDILIFLSDAARIPSTMYGVQASNVHGDRRILTDYMLFRTYVGKKFFIGINSGALFLAAMSNCDIIHNVRNHVSPHFIALNDETMIKSEGMHTQMMYPYDMNPITEFTVLGTSCNETKRSNYYKDSKSLHHYDLDCSEPEIVFFHKTESLCFQSDIQKTHLKKSMVKIKQIITQCFKQHITV